MSLCGRPNMDEELEDAEEEPTVPMQNNNNNNTAADEFDEEDEEDVCDDDDDDDDEDEWNFTVTNGSVKAGTLDTLRDAILSNNGENEGGMFFVPEPVVSLLNDTKPTMPLLDKEQLPPGTTVWVVDEDDVKLLLKDAWDPPIRVICNGRASGVVQRHNGDLTLVSFVNDSIGMSFAFTLPRPCLSILPIEPYESNHTANKQNALASSFGVGNLGPRAGRGTARTKEEVNILQQYYEVMVPNIVKCKNVQDHWDLFVKGKVDAPLTEVTKLIQEAEAAPPIATPEGSPLLGSRGSSVSSGQDSNNSSGTLTLKELYCIRSMMRIFAHDATGALEDAMAAIQLNPAWVKGYLRAARAYQGCGKFTLASHMINQTLLLMPHSDDVNRLSDLNNYLRCVNAELELAVPHMGIRLSSSYAKLLMPKRGFQLGEVIFEETDPVLSMASMQNTTPCCTVCLRTTGLTEMPTHHVTRPYCSQSCFQRATLFSKMELVTHELGLRSATGLIYSKAASSMNMLPLEQARLTMRLFFIVCTTHTRLQSQREQQQVQQSRSIEAVLKTFNGSSSSVGIEEALQHLGIFPLVSSSIDNKTKDDLTTLCKVLCQGFTPEEASLYNPSLFLGLFSYVSNHVIYAETSAAGSESPSSSTSVVKAYHLGKLSGCIEIGSGSGDVPNCEVQVRHPGVLTVVATQEIFKDNRLLRPPLKTTQH